jgi:hypothetical protein
MCVPVCMWRGGVVTPPPPPSLRFRNNLCKDDCAFVHQVPPWLLSVFRIHDILMWIRIRGSMPRIRIRIRSCYFRHWPSRCQQKTNFLIPFFRLVSFWRYIYVHYFSKIKSQKESQNSRLQGFSYYFYMMIEGSGSRAGSGSIPLTSGSGSGSRRPINTWIRWIRIRIRLRNTGCYVCLICCSYQMTG